MGIRFLCPNGHKLNVKTFLAGKRGICPQCDAKFFVPTESGGQVEAINLGAGPEAEQPQPDPQPQQQTTAPPPAPNLPAEASAEPATTEQELWYVRLASGEQFGPASLEVLQEWVADGRVTDGCWVWRTGWPEWKTSAEVLPQLNGPPIPPMPVPESPEAPVAEASPEVPQEGAPQATLPEPNYATNVYRLTRRNRQERAKKATMFLGGLVLILLVVLVAVLINNNR